jgi:membrane protein YqaA with SNARE-associated domain
MTDHQPAGAPAPSPPPAPDGTQGVGRATRRIARLLEILHDWAESGWSRSAIATWGVLNGSVVPGPSDAVFAPLGLTDPKRVYEFALWAIGGAVVGGLIAYAIGALAFDNVGRPILGWLGFGPSDLEATRALFARRGWLVVVIGSLPLVSPKLVSIAAGAFGVPFWQFALAIFGVRLVRAMIVATLIRYAGTGVTKWVERHVGHRLRMVPRD